LLNSVKAFILIGKSTNYRLHRKYVCSSTSFGWKGRVSLY